MDIGNFGLARRRERGYDGGRFGNRSYESDKCSDWADRISRRYGGVKKSSFDRITG